MQFRDLKTQYTVLKDEMDKVIFDVVASSAYVMGPKIKEMETAFAEYVGVKHCIACNSGTDALLLALKAWDVKPGDAVFVPSFTFFASAEVIAMQGATPVFVDVDKDTFNMDVADLERKIEQTLKTGKLTPRVIIAVDLFGLPADFKAIRKLANQYHLYVLEDGAQGFGCHPDDITRLLWELGRRGPHCEKSLLTRALESSEHGRGPPVAFLSLFLARP